MPLDKLVGRGVGPEVIRSLHLGVLQGAGPHQQRRKDGAIHRVHQERFLLIVFTAVLHKVTHNFVQDLLKQGSTDPKVLDGKWGQTGQLRQLPHVLLEALDLVSHALDQLLQVLDFVAQLLSRWEALAHFHEESCDLVAAQETRRPPPQPMQDTGLHSRTEGDDVAAVFMDKLPRDSLLHDLLHLLLDGA